MYDVSAEGRSSGPCIDRLRRKDTTMDDATLDRELGPRLHWTPAPPPARVTLQGRHVTLEPMDADRHAGALFEAAQGEGADPLLWQYLGYGPFRDRDAYRAWVEAASASPDPLFHAVIPTGGEASGQTSYLRIDPANGVIEIGHIWFGGRMQRSPATTEAIYLLARHAFDDLGYRRLEWKCNARNDRSRAAAVRLGFTYEGTFRNHTVVRDRNRDTAWYAIIDEDWPAIRAAFEEWLDPANFDDDGRQRRSLAEVRSAP
jgi:RimJ/RimL family protein N-acetyltransferase